MKLREQGGRRGGRKSFLSAAEAVGRPEVVEPAKFKWIEIQHEKETLAKLFAALKDSRQEEPVKGVVGKDVRKMRLRLAFYLTTLCHGHPELLNIQPEELKEIALQRMGDDDFTSDADDYLAGVFSREARQEIRSSTGVDQSLSKTRTGYGKIHILFGLATGAPDLLLKKRGVLTSLLPQEINSLRVHEGKSAVTEAAWLVLLFPEKRGEIPSALTASSVADHQRNLGLANTLLIPSRIRLDDAWYIGGLLFEQQVLAAQDGKILPNGEIELTPPTKVLQPATRLPERLLS